MSPQTKKLWKDTKAKVLPLTVLAMFIIAGLTAVFVISPNSDNVVIASGENWWSNDWNKRVLITFNTSLVNGTNDNFPVLVYINSTIGSLCDSGDSIRFIDYYDNSTEFYYEIDESFNVGGTSYVWVNYSSDSGLSDTRNKLWLYYNNTGASDNQQPWNVWSEYGFVSHMCNNTEDASEVISSVDNTSLYESGAGTINDVSAVINTGQKYENDIYHKNTTAGVIDNSKNGTFECWGGFVTDNNSQYLLIRATDDNGRVYFSSYQSDIVSTFGTSTVKLDTGYTHNTGNILDHYVLTWSPDGDLFAYCNATLIGSALNTASLTGTETNFGTGLSVDGTIDEVRYIAKNMSEDYIVTSFNTQAYPESFCLYGSQEENIVVAGTYGISGLDVNTRFTHSGEAGDTNISLLVMKVYSNTSGTTDNCTDIFLDFSGGYPSGYSAGNFSFQVRNTSDGTFSTDWNTVTGNMTLNSTTWAGAWAYGTNPFPITGYNSTIEVRMRVVIPNGATVGTNTTDSWSVLWKINTS